MRKTLFISFRYLTRARRGEGNYLAGAAFGIALSLVPIVVTLVVADGMIRGITDRFIELGTGHLQVWDMGNANLFPENLDYMASITEATEGVTGFWRETQGMALIVGNAGKTGATVRAVESSFWKNAGSAKYLKVIAGDTSLEDNEVLLGEALAKKAGAEVGKPVRLMTVRVSDDGRNIPRTNIFTVRGIVSSGYHELDQLWCITTYAAGKRILDPHLAYTYLIAKVADPYRDAGAVAARIHEAAGFGYEAFTWKDLQRSQYSSYESTRQLLLFIMALIVLVASVNVSSATSMLVIERQRDIAVLKAFGASPAAVSRIFLSGAFLTGAAGSAGGIAAGLLIGCFINQIIRSLERALSLVSSLFHGEAVHILDPEYYLETIPIVIDWTAVFLIGLLTIAASIIASWLPSRSAGKQKPVDLLRKY
jgi:lipoprotein-releasing system permease protein